MPSEAQFMIWMDHHHREFWKKTTFKPLFLWNHKSREVPTGAAPESKEEVKKLEDTLENRPEFINREDPRFKALEEGIGRYNSLRRNHRRYLETVYFDESETYVDLAETLKNVKELLDKPNRMVRKKDKENLRRIKNSLIQLIGPANVRGEEVDAHTQIPEETNPQILEQYGNQLAQMNAGRLEDGQTLETFRDNSIYSQIESSYTQFSSFNEFKSLQNDQMGRYNDALARENKALFLTVMQRETDNFSRYRETISDQDVYIKEQMRRFQSALDIADQGIPGQASEALRPGVKRILVGHYFESLQTQDQARAKGESAWTLTQLSLSPYFNNESPQQHTQAFERATIGLALAGGRIAKRLEENVSELEIIEKNLKKEDLKWGLLDLFVNDEDKNKYGTPQAFLEARKTDLLNQNESYQAFLNEVKTVVQNPVDAQGNLHPNLIEWDKNGHPEGFVTQGELSQMNRRFERLEMNSSLFSKQEAGRDTISVMRSRGMDLRYTHRLYLRELLKTPRIDVDNWDNMSPAELANVMEQIIPPMNLPANQDGRRALISTLRSMHLNESDPQKLRAYQAAMLQVSEIKNMIRKMNTLEAERKAIMPQIEKEMGNDVMGLNDGVRMGWELLKQQLFSPNWLDKLSAGVAIYVGYKVLQKAWKHDDFLGKALAGGGLAVVANNLVEAATGHDYSKDLFRGFKETANIGLQNKAKNTYESLLIEQGSNEMDIPEEGQSAISDTEHFNALMAMKNVPYHRLMAWYEASDKTQPGYSEAHEKRLFSRLGTDVSDVVGGGLRGEEKDERTRFVMKKAFKNSVALYAQQNNMSERRAQLAMKEVYITSVAKRNYTPSLATPFPGIYETFHGREERLTFETVMSIETSPYLVESTMVKNGYDINAGEMAYNAKKTAGEWMDRSRQFAGEKYEQASEWVGEQMETKMPDVEPEPITPESIAQASEGGDDLIKPSVEHEDHDEELDEEDLDEERSIED